MLFYFVKPTLFLILSLFKIYSILLLFIIKIV